MRRSGGAVPSKEARSGEHIMKKALILIVCGAVAAISAACASSPNALSSADGARQVYQDKKITGLIYKKLIDDRLTRALSITPRCYDGRVYLIGEYESEDEKNHAVAIAREVEGVVSLETYLVPRAGRTDADEQDDVRLSAEVKKNLVASGAVSTARLDVVSVQKHIVLVGIVKNEKEIARATEIAQGVEGVQSVISYLTVFR
jgi:hyperosmotically inducible periplasmic protein